MSEEMTTTMEFAPAVELPFRVRVRHGVRQPQNWLQLVRFAAVGASGYAVNLAVFAACVHLLGMDYRIAFVIAFVISVANNFWWNRHWTFDAKHEHPIFQGTRFFAVSALAQAFAYVVLVTLVDGRGLPKGMAQAIAIAAATTLALIGQELWSFLA